MKKMIYLFLICSGMQAAHAQYYSFSVSSRAYSEMTEPDFTDTTFHDYIPFEPLYPYKIFGKSGMTDYSIGVATGYLVVSSRQFGFALDPMMGTLFRKIPGQSSVSIKELKTATDTLLLVQWKQIGLQGHPDNEFVNFQLRLYLGSEKVEFHYGPSHYVRTTNDSAFMEPRYSGPEVMVVLLYPDFSGYFEFTALTGDPASPVYSQNYGRLSALPVPNQMYTFQKKGGVGLQEQNLLQDVQLFPNPAVDRTVGFSSPVAIQQIKLYSLAGELLMQLEGGNTIQLPEGSQLFYAEITLINGMQCIKKIVSP